MDESITAFTLFKNSLQSPKSYKNGNQSFIGRVVYKTGGVVREEVLKVTLLLEGYESCKINIDDGSILRAGEVYLSFSPEYQDYTFTKGGYLIITGTGRNGAYEVKICEVKS
jgi:hypothetical protein